MPGMMDTVLNLGLNDAAVEGLAAKYGERFAMDCFRRLLQMFGDVVLSIPHHDFEQEMVAMKTARGLKFDVELNAADLRELVAKFKEVYKRHDQTLPTDPWEQLSMGIDAVFRCAAAAGCCCG
jgi:pyruvate,orthophosphate dikinase